MTTESDKGALILVVDDDYDFLALARLALEKAGFAVATASDAQQALATMAAQKPDLVIADLMMASLDSGFSLARTIKENAAYADVPVVIVTSVTSTLGLDFRPRSELDRQEMHIDAYFNKPLDFAQLLQELDKLLPRPEANP